MYVIILFEVFRDINLIPDTDRQTELKDFNSCSNAGGNYEMNMQKNQAKSHKLRCT